MLKGDVPPPVAQSHAALHALQSSKWWWSITPISGRWKSHNSWHPSRQCLISWRDPGY